MGRGALHPQRSGGCKPPPPCRQLPHQSGILFWLLSFIPHPHHGSWNHTPCLRLGLKDARGSALLCFSPCDKAGRGVTKFTCTWRGKAFLPLGEEDTWERKQDTPIVSNHGNPKAEAWRFHLGTQDTGTPGHWSWLGVTDSNSITWDTRTLVLAGGD